MHITRVLLTGSNGALDSVTTASTNGPSYYDYFSSAFVPVLQTGQQYTLTVTIDNHGFADVAVAAWIDFNGDEAFDSWEKIGQQNTLGVVLST